MQLSPPGLPQGLTEIPDLVILLAADFPSWPFRSLPFAPFALPFSFCFFRASLAACFSAFFRAFRSAFAFRRNFSALASARCFLRFFSQASHLQPIGFR